MEQPAPEMSPRATALAVLTLVGLSVLPALHLIVHDQLEPHAHGPAAGHCHGGECHEHSDEAGDEAADAPGDEAPESNHGTGSLAHQDLALAVAPPPLPPIGVSRLAAPSAAATAGALSDRIHAADRRARGPPLAS